MSIPRELFWLPPLRNRLSEFVRQSLVHRGGSSSDLSTIPHRGVPAGFVRTQHPHYGRCLLCFYVSRVYDMTRIDVRMFSALACSSDLMVTKGVMSWNEDEPLFRPTHTSFVLASTKGRRKWPEREGHSASIAGIETASEAETKVRVRLSFTSQSWLTMISWP